MLAALNIDREDTAIVVAAFDRLWKFDPDDIEADWINAMAKRLLREINRQLASMEAVKYDKETNQPLTGDRLKNARTLATLRDTLEKVTRLKLQHEVTLETRKDRDYESKRKAIYRRATEHVARRKDKDIS